MLEQYVRSYYQRYLVDGLAERIQDYITPTQVTILGGLLGVAVPIALFAGNQWAAVILLLGSGYFDTVDGTIARKKKAISDVGSLFDIFTDRVVEFAVILGLWIVAPHERALMCLLMLGSIFLCVTSFLTVGIFSENHSKKSFHYSPGLIERPEAFIFFVLMILCDHYFSLLSATFVVLVGVTTAVRLYEFWRMSER